MVHVSQQTAMQWHAGAGIISPRSAGRREDVEVEDVGAGGDAGAAGRAPAARAAADGWATTLACSRRSRRAETRRETRPTRRADWRSWSTPVTFGVPHQRETTRHTLSGLHGRRGEGELRLLPGRHRRLAADRGRDRPRPQDTAVLHFGSVVSWTPPADRHIHSAVQRVRATGTALISYDPNIRPSGTRQAGRRAQRRLCPPAQGRPRGRRVALPGYSARADRRPLVGPRRTTRRHHRRPPTEPMSSRLARGV